MLRLALHLWSHWLLNSIHFSKWQLANSIAIWTRDPVLVNFQPFISQTYFLLSVHFRINFLPTPISPLIFTFPEIIRRKNEGGGEGVRKRGKKRFNFTLSAIALSWTCQLSLPLPLFFLFFWVQCATLKVQWHRGTNKTQVFKEGSRVPKHRLHWRRPEKQMEIDESTCETLAICHHP